MSTYVIILVGVILLGIPTVIVVNKYPKTRTVFQVLFLALIVLFSYLLIVNIRKPILFDKELNKRIDATVERLKEVRTLQIVFKDKYGKYTGDLDSLINFVKHDSIEITKLVAVKKWYQDEMTRSEAIKKGILKLEKSYVHANDSLWNTQTYPVGDLKYVPFTQKKVELTMGAGEVEASKIKVQVFECYAKYEDLLNGMDKQLVANFIDEKTTNNRFDGLKVGSLEEATNNAGNWEQ